MASTRKITINSCFAFRDDEGKEHYFTPASNPDEVVKVLGDEDLDARIQSGVISDVTPE